MLSEESERKKRLRRELDEVKSDLNRFKQLVKWAKDYTGSEDDPALE